MSRVSTSLVIEVKESVVLGTNGLVLYTKDKNNITIKVPDQATTVSFSDLEEALNMAKTFVEGKKVTAVAASVPESIENTFEIEYLGADGSSAPEFNGN